MKLWLDEAYGPVDSIVAVVDRARYFRLDAAAVRRVLGQVYTAVLGWRQVATSVEVGMSPQDLEDFAPAFENEQMRIAEMLLR